MSDSGPKDDAAALREGIERTRGEMSVTVNEIEQRLSPARIEEQVADLKESVLGNYHEAKNHLKEDLSRELQGAKEKVKEELLEVKEKVQEEIGQARSAVHDATVVKVENMVLDASDMVHNAGETVSGAGSSILETIKANPVPAALVAVGVGWLIMSSRKSTSARAMPRRLYAGEYDDESRFGYGGSYGRYDYDARMGGPRRLIQRGQRAVGGAIHSVEERAVDVGQAVQHGAQHLAEQASGVAHDVGERLDHYTEDARIRGRQMVRRGVREVRRAEQSFEGTLRENPLAVGAVALAVGAAIGLALPSTQGEDQWMGTMKDKLVDRAEDMAGEALHVVEEKVTHQLEGASQESQEPKNGLSNGISGKSDKTKSSSV
jgi:hypothetical protein